MEFIHVFLKIDKIIKRKKQGKLLKMPIQGMWWKRLLRTDFLVFIDLKFQG